MRSRFAYLFSAWNRKQKLNYILKFALKHKVKTILLVGVSPRSRTSSYENLIEQGLLAQSQFSVTVTGLEQNGDGWPNWIQANALQLPFGSSSFDLVLSNAVIEHVGTEVLQRIFVSEHVRVGKNWIITTPNRLFPIEAHTHIFLKHMRKGWSTDSVTRLLSKSELKAMLPVNNKIVGNSLWPTFLAHNKEK